MFHWLAHFTLSTCGGIRSRTQIGRVRFRELTQRFNSARPQSLPLSWSVSSTWSSENEPTFWLGGNSFSNQIIDQHKPLFTRTSYWFTLQPGRKSYRIFAKQMTNPPAACGSHAPTPIKKTATTKTVQDKADATKSSH
jgi:hypothetical protein